MRALVFSLAALFTSAFASAQVPVLNDDCATATPLVGTNLVLDVDLANATTSAHGQLNTACALGGSTAITRDVWFRWTAPFGGRFIVSTCGATYVDTKLAVYDAALLVGGCPATLTSSPVIGCNDDMSTQVPQARVVFDAVANAQYLIQLGTSPFAAAGGLSWFSLTSYEVDPEPTPCIHDDGSSDGRASFALPFGGEEGVLQAFGRPNVPTQIFGAWVAYGALFGSPNSALADNTPVRVYLFEDPNDDGDPTDGLLLDVADSVVQLHDSDYFNLVPFLATPLVNGVYFIGWSIQTPSPPPPNFAPFGYDLESCAALPGESWGVSNSMAPLNLGALAQNTLPPTRTNFGTNLTWMIRPVCDAVVVIGEPLCTNALLNVDHVTPCPCGNTGAPANGCAHSFSAAGANLAVTGFVPTDNVVLHVSNLPATSFTLFMQHASSADQVFHDGTICAGPPLIRLRGGAAVAGQAHYPIYPPPFSPTLSERGGVSVGSGMTRFYAGWYRNASSTFCPPKTANVTNGWRIVW